MVDPEEEEVFIAPREAPPGFDKGPDRPFERFDKYMVLKNSDIATYLTERERELLYKLEEKINYCRDEDDKDVNEYVVVNETAPYAECIWGLIEIGERQTSALPGLLRQVTPIVFDILTKVRMRSIKE